MLVRHFDLRSFSNPVLVVQLRSIWSRFAGAVQKVVHDNPSEEPPAKRIARGRKALRDLFAERGRLLRMKTPVVPTEKTQEDTVPEDANAE